MARFFRRKQAVKRNMPLAKTAALPSSTQFSISKNRQPLDYLRNKGIIKDDSSEAHLKEVRKLCREYYKYTDLIPMIITIYAKFPLQGMRISCKTPELQELFDEQFMSQNGLNYREYLPELGKEFFKVGEVNSFAIFDKATKWWLSEEILNPDEISVDTSVFVGEETVTLTIPDTVKNAFTERGSADQQYLAEMYPDLEDAILAGKPVILNPDFIYRIVDKADPWDTRGTPMMTRAFEPLLQQEILNAAQDAIADRLYSPLVLARLGIPASEMGKDQPPWIPTQEQLDSFARTFDEALAADFRAIIHHFGIDIRSVFGRESMPRLDNDFDRVERRIMRAFGIGQGLLDGSNQGAYASSAINRDFVSQMMASYQEHIKGLFNHRARIFAESRNLFETTTGKDGKTEPVMESYADTDEEGNIVIKQRPVIYVPELVFSSNPLRDPSFEINLLMTMKQAGAPISDQTIMEASTLSIDIDDELERIRSEEVAKKVSQIAMAQDLDAKLTEMNIDTSEAGMIQHEEQLERLEAEDDATESIEKAEQETATYKPSKELS